MSSTAHKICLVGEPGVGKTSLVQCLLGDSSAQHSGSANSHGMTVAAYQLRDPTEPVSIMLWDLAGRSALDSLNQAFLSGIDGVVAVADAARPTSAAAALSLVAQIRRLYPGTPALLLHNKRDLAAPATIAALPAAADVSVFEVSARNGESVEAAFTVFARRLHAVRARIPRPEAVF